MNTEERMIGASRVADILGISESYAYVVIRELNKERFFSPNAESGEKPIQEGR